MKLFLTILFQGENANDEIFQQQKLKSTKILTSTQPRQSWQTQSTAPKPDHRHHMRVLVSYIFYSFLYNLLYILRNVTYEKYDYSTVNDLVFKL